MVGPPGGELSSNGVDSGCPCPYYTPTMKKNIDSFLRAGAFTGVVLWSALCGAAEPGAIPARGVAPVQGRVLVLDNEQTLTGEIELDRDEYRIKRLVGETRVPVGKVLRLCASLEEAYQ